MVGLLISRQTNLAEIVIWQAKKDVYRFAANYVCATEQRVELEEHADPNSQLNFFTAADIVDDHQDLVGKLKAGF
jgi:hypothetical protein